MLFILSLAPLVSRGENAPSLHDTAKKYLDAMVAAEGNAQGCKWEQVCGSLKAMRMDYSYRCTFEAIDCNTGGQYAVYLDRNFKLVSLLRGKKAKGKLQFSFREGVGHTLVKPTMPGEPEPPASIK